MNTTADLVPNRRIALLIDAENVSGENLSAIVDGLSAYGSTHVRRAYGDWSSEGLKGWKAKLHEFGIKPIQQFSYTSGKNATDIALVIDAMELLYTQKPDAFCIVSSDADFTPLIMQLRAHGIDVYGCGAEKTPRPFRMACTAFMVLHEKRAEPEQTVVVQEVKEIQQPVPVSGLPIARSVKDAALVALLAEAIDGVSQDGWACLGAAGNAAKRANIEPEEYGATNFSALFKATGAFDIQKSDAGQSYIAAKRNKQRAARPMMAAT